MLPERQLAVLRASPPTKRVATAISLAGFTQVTVAAAIGVTQAYVSDVARGRYPTITVASGHKFTRFFGCSIDDDPERIATFADPLLRAKLAGTTTIGQARLTDVTAGYQLLAGVDYRLRDPITVGVKLRWAAFSEFESEPMPWNQLWSHESSVGRGDAVLCQVTTDDSKFWGVSFSLKYRF